MVDTELYSTVNHTAYADTHTVDALRDEAFLHSLGPAPARNHLAVFTWMRKRRPLAPGEGDFIYHVDDFVSLPQHSDKERRMKNFIESRLDNRPNSWLRVSHPFSQQADSF